MHQHIIIASASTRRRKNVLIPKSFARDDALFFHSMNKSLKQVVMPLLSFIFFLPTCFLISLRPLAFFGVLERPSRWIASGAGKRKNSWHLVTSTIYWINIDVWAINHGVQGWGTRRAEDLRARMLPLSAKLMASIQLSMAKASEERNIVRKRRAIAHNPNKQSKDQLIFRCQKSLIFLRLRVGRLMNRAGGGGESCKSWPSGRERCSLDTFRVSDGGHETKSLHPSRKQFKFSSTLMTIRCDVTISSGSRESISPCHAIQWIHSPPLFERDVL